MGQKGKGLAVTFLRAHMNDADGECLIWPFSCNQYGYGLCSYNGRNHKASRLMCEFVHGPPPTPKHHAAHSCGRGQEGCVHPKHVRWATPTENMQESVRLGAVRKPGQIPRHKLTEEDVAQIKALKGQKSQHEIGLMFGVKGKQIGRIHRGECWTDGKRKFGGFSVKPYRGGSRPREASTR